VSKLKTPIVAAIIAFLIGCGGDVSQDATQTRSGLAQPDDDVVVYDLVAGPANPFTSRDNGSVLQYRPPGTYRPPVVLGLAGTMELVREDGVNFRFLYRVTSVHIHAVDHPWTLEGEGAVGYFRALSLDPVTPLDVRLTLISSRGGGAERVELVGRGDAQTFTTSRPPSFTGVRLAGDGYHIILWAVPRAQNSRQDVR